MLKIIIQNLHQKVISFEKSSKSVLNVLHENHIGWLHCCGAKGRCTTCKMIVNSGMELLSPLSESELQYQAMDLLGLNERLACQVIPSGVLSILVPEENKLPHIKYC